MIPYPAIELIIPNDGTTAFAVYCLFVKRTNRKTGALFPSLQQIADDIGMTKQSVVTALAKLKDSNVIEIRRGNRTKSNHYVIHDPKDWKYESKNSYEENLESKNHTTGSLKIRPEVVQKLDSNNIEDETNNISGKKPDVKEVGPKGRPLNKRFELYRAYCEARGEDVNDEVGRDIKLRMFTKDFVEAMEPHDVKELYQYVLNKWNRIAKKKGEQASLPEIIHMKREYADWMATKRYKAQRTMNTYEAPVVTEKEDDELSEARIAQKQAEIDAHIAQMEAKRARQVAVTL
jgi:DNA-binding transcriptional regulator YhcF (GntR family)